MPKSHELRSKQQATTDKEAGRDFPIHSKEVLTIDRRAVLALPSERPQQVKVLEKAYEWLTDPELYARSQSDRPAVARLSSNDIDKLLSTGKIEKVPSGRENTPLGQCSVHKVLELLKKRWRVVQHPKDVNAYTPDADKVQFMKFLERHKAVHAGTYALDLDFVSFFDAFELDPEVRRYFCFTFNGQQYRMCVMPMGAKQSVKVAHETTVQLLNFVYAYSGDGECRAHRPLLPFMAR